MKTSRAERFMLDLQLVDGNSLSGGWHAFVAAANTGFYSETRDQCGGKF